jgi:ComF family protein
VQRLHKRGYNQSKLLTQVAATYLKKPDSSAAIVREQHTRPQVGLSRRQRRSNVSGAFRATASFNGQRVLLVDDVYTTGATLRACAQALANRGAAAVYAITLTAAA